MQGGRKHPVRIYPGIQIISIFRLSSSDAIALALELSNTPLAYTSEKYGIPQTSVFTRSILELLPDDAYRKLQLALIASPEAGALIRRGGGIRKLRFALPGTGKSGGTRIIYYWIRERRQIYMLMAYPKSKKDDLSDKETAILHDIVKEL